MGRRPQRGTRRERYPLKWPRNRLARAFCRGGLRAAFRLLARVELTGRENLPPAGPLIVAGNHSSFLDVILMIAFAPKRLELIGTGDIPMDPAYAWIADFYGFIPVKRGSADSRSLESSIGVLGQGGFLGIFPQGGIWNRRRTRAQKGVAWLSAAGKAPVLPMGFGWRKGAFGAIFALAFPRITVGIGPAIPALTGADGGEPRREELDAYAERVMDAIESLIPGDLRPGFEAPEREAFASAAFSVAADGTERPIALDPAQARNLGFLFFHPVLIRTFSRNLHLRAVCLGDITAPIPASAVRDAMSDLAHYLDGENRFFFTYRIGAENAKAMRAAFGTILDAATEAGVERLRFTAERRWRLPGDADDRVDRLPGGAALHMEF
jgi:1-acyl-sn-glycerol-3-phosphate acyltransferase